MTLGAGLTAFGVSNELYVANDETVILAGFLIFATLLGRSVAKPYTNWADSTIAKISGILNALAATERELPMVLNALRRWKLRCPKNGLDLVFPAPQAVNTDSIRTQPLIHQD